jgi:uncharacterized UBP type Zn finger protein
MKTPYHIHSILVHEGSSDFGHYYAFIYDRKINQWYRFNDFKVFQVTEEVVF